MIIMTHVLIPTASARELGKRVLELPPFPEYLTISGPYLYSVEGEGIHSTDIFEIDQSRMAEALEFLNNRHVAFFDVPGYTYGIYTCLEAIEGLKMLGLE